MTPGWITDVFAAIMLMVAAVSATRLVAARQWQRGAVVTDTGIAHLLMGIAMAGMLATGLTTLPNGAWVAVFAVLAAWFGYRVMRGYRASGARALAAGHCAPHLVHSAAMAYMFAAITAPAAGGMAGLGGTGGIPKLHVPTLAFLFALILIGYTIWDLDQLASLLRGFVPAVAGVASPALVGGPAGAFGTEAVAGSGAGGLAAGSPAGSGGTGPGSTAGGDRIGALSILDSPEIVVGCRITMGVTMALLLILMF